MLPSEATDPVKHGGGARSGSHIQNITWGILWLDSTW